MESSEAYDIWENLKSRGRWKYLTRAAASHSAGLSKYILIGINYFSASEHCRGNKVFTA